MGSEMCIRDRVRTIDLLAKNLGFYGKLMNLREKYKKGLLSEYKLSLLLAEKLKGIKKREVYSVLNEGILREKAVEILRTLRGMKIKTAIVTQAFSPLVEYFREKGLNPDFLACIELEEENGIFTGRIKNPSVYFNPGCELKHMVCKELVLKKLSKEWDIPLDKVVGVGDGRGDICMFRLLNKKGGLSVGIGDKETIKPFVKFRVKKLEEILSFF